MVPSYAGDSGTSWESKCRLRLLDESNISPQTEQRSLSPETLSWPWGMFPLTSLVVFSGVPQSSNSNGLSRHSCTCMLCRRKSPKIEIWMLMIPPMMKTFQVDEYKNKIMPNKVQTFLRCSKVFVSLFSSSADVCLFICSLVIAFSCL